MCNVIGVLLAIRQDIIPSLALPRQVLLLIAIRLYQ
jgi:hypothetical protein